MKNIVLGLLLTVSLSSPIKTVRADIFGGDVAVLTQILFNAIQQLTQLKKVYDNAKNGVNLVREINRGINDSLNLIKKINPNFDPGIFKNWENTDFALSELERLYGNVTESPEADVQKNMDQGIAEAVTLNNEVFKHAKQIDQLGEQIKHYSHSVSPGGAQKLTAQSMGIMLQAFNESLRVQATGLKLQAQSAAIQNKREKNLTKMTLESSRQLKLVMKNEKSEFKFPRFN